MSNLFAPTLRENPAEAEIASHRLMLRAGLVRKLSAGIYTYLPLGYRVLKKVMDIVREEMDAAGAQEIVMPLLQPAELWHESGRWSDYGDELMKLQDRHGRMFALGPTHEEVVTDLVRHELKSYRQLPLILYQIQNKYRDEIRPRFGLIRGREFVMKDAYSFDRDEAGLDISYQKMFEAYKRIFARCGLHTLPVEADAGAIGGSNTHEFMVLTDATGEAKVVYCDECGYAANVEKAESQFVPDKEMEDAEAGTLEKVATPNQRTVEEVADFLGVNPKQVIKTLIYRAGNQNIAALIRGDHELNEVKLARAVGVLEVEMADEALVRETTGASVGFAGPIGLSSNVRIIADPYVMELKNAVCGGNTEDMHYKGVVPGRDFSVEKVVDLRLVEENDPCPKCGTPLKLAYGIEVGQVFKLGTKYSQAMGATYLDDSGAERPFVMGCYGIGISRTVAAIVEQHHDEHGIVWPISVAPYHVIVVPVNARDQEQMETAEKLYKQFLQAGVEAVLDDRDERPGVKFKDADLIGFPIRIVVGKSLTQGQVEVKLRWVDAPELVSIDGVLARVQEILSAKE